MRTVRAIAILLFVGFMACGILAMAAEAQHAVWSTYRGDNANTGSAHSVTLKGKVKWKIDLRSMSASEVVFDGRGMGFISFRLEPTKTFTSAFNCKDGSFVWWKDVVHAASSRNLPTPAIDSEGNVYTIAQDGRVIARKGSDGSQIWSFDSAVADPAPRVWPPRVYKDTIYVGVGSDLYALDRRTGAQKHRGENQIPLAIAADGTLYVAGAGVVAAVDPVSWKTLWTFKTDLYHFPLLDAEGRRIYIGTGEAGFACLDSVSGRRIWSTHGPLTTSDLASAPNGPIIANDASSRTESLYAIDRLTGKVAWTYSPISGPETSPCVGDDGTVYTTIIPKLIAIDGKTHKKKWALDLHLGMYYSAPSLGPDGLLYVVGDGGGTLYAIE